MFFSGKTITLSAAAFTLCLLLCSCATMPRESLTMTVDPQGRISVAGKYTTLEDVGKAAKKAGASESTNIELQISEKTSASLSKKILKKLAHSGYSRVHLRRKRTPTVYKKSK